MFLMSLQILLHKICINLYSHHQCMRVCLSSPTNRCTILQFNIFQFGKLKYYLSSVLNCLLLIMYDVEHNFVCLRIIFSFLSRNYLYFVYYVQAFVIFSQFLRNPYVVERFSPVSMIYCKYFISICELYFYFKIFYLLYFVMSIKNYIAS